MLPGNYAKLLESPPPGTLAIPAMPGYAIQRDGVVWTCRKRPAWVRKRLCRNDGYLAVKLHVGGKQICKRVCVLVLLTYKGPKPFPKAVCRHLDGVKDNNTDTNLEWSTVTQNNRDTVLHGRHFTARGVESCHAKLTNEQVLEIRKRCEAGEVHERIAEDYGVKRNAIHSIHNRTSWKHL